MKKILKSLNGETSFPPPIWMMRQAGRYLPEYRESRAKAGSFLDLCYSPEFATEVTLQPIKRFDFDAAILFSDILVVPDGLGQNVKFMEGKGPLLDPIKINQIDDLSEDLMIEVLQPVFDAVKLIRRTLPKEKTLIGFCGAPWTVATYMIAGHGTPDQAPARLMMLKEPEAFQKLIDILISASSKYLIEQIKSGADCLQVFDTWSGVLSEKEFKQYCLLPLKKIITNVRSEFPDIPFIGFPKGGSHYGVSFIEETDINGIGVDWTVPLSFIKSDLQPKACVQGNLDPLMLISGGQRMIDQIEEICTVLKEGPHIFNLGHGITPQTPIKNVEQMIETVRSMK